MRLQHAVLTAETFGAEAAVTYDRLGWGLAAWLKATGRFDLGLGVLVRVLAIEDVGVDVPDEEGIGVDDLEMACSGCNGWSCSCGGVGSFSRMGADGDAVSAGFGSVAAISLSFGLLLVGMSMGGWGSSGPVPPRKRNNRCSVA